MRRTLSLLVLLPLLAACTPTQTAVDTGSTSSPAAMIADIKPVLNVKLDQTTTEDAQGVPSTKATLTFSGVVDKVVDLGNIQGPITAVDEKAYVNYVEPLGNVALVLTAWFAGQGEEIWVTQHMDTKAVSVQHRYGGEEGTCTDPEQIAEFSVPATVSFTFEGLGTRVDQSSLAFCRTQN